MMNKLIKAFSFDWVSSTIAAACVSPTVAAIDRAFAANTAGTHGVIQSLRITFKEMILTPHRYFLRKPDFWILVTLYSTTYGTANMYDSWYRRKNHGSKKRSAKQEFNKILGVSAVNTVVSIWKDYMFAKLCYPGDITKMKKPKMPLSSYVIFFLRDSSIIAMSFTFPHILVHELHTRYGFDKTKSYLVAQFISPVLAMTWTAPMSTLALDLYNNKNSTIKQRAALVRKLYFSAVATKMARIIPPYSFGPSTNRFVREYFEKHEDTQHWD